MRIRRRSEVIKPAFTWIDTTRRRFVVLGPCEALWTGGAVPDVGGAIVWLQPPPELEREQLDSVEQAVRNACAYAVTFIAARRGKVLLEGEAEAEPIDDLGLTLPTIREAVADVLAAAKLTEDDRVRVTAIVEAALAAEGI